MVFEIWDPFSILHGILGWVSMGTMGISGSFRGVKRLFELKNLAFFRRMPGKILSGLKNPTWENHPTIYIPHIK